VSLLDTHRSLVTSPTPVGSGRPAVELEFCAVTITKPRETFVVEDATEDARFRENPHVTGAPNIRLYAGHPLEATNGEVVGTLHIMDDRPRQFSDAEKEALRDLAVGLQRELAATTEMSLALSVQQNLLPTSAPRLVGYEIAGACQPSQGVSGDFFDWNSAPGGLTLTVADVMGKGVAAAMIRSAVRTAFRMAQRLGDVSDTLAAVAQAVDEDLVKNNSFVTAFHAHLEESTGRLKIVDAGHGLSIILRADGSREVVPSANFPIGVLPGRRWETSTVYLNLGDELLIFSDGILDVFDGSLESLDDAALEQALRELPNTTSPVSTPVSQLLVDTGLTTSVGESRRAIAQGGVYLNNVRVEDESATVEGSVLSGGFAVLRRGKKTLAGVFVE